MSTIESTVTRLLVATKQLLESLTQWAKGDASEHDVSDVYVVLGNEFNIACRAFMSADVDVSDLGDVPQALRVILERALSEDASQQNLEKYLPSIREIIVNLLRQLKTKQTIVRSRQQQQQPQQTFPPGPQQASNPHPRYNAYNSKPSPTGPPHAFRNNPPQQAPASQQRSISHSIPQAPQQVTYPARAESLNRPSPKTIATNHRNTHIIQSPINGKAPSAVPLPSQRSPTEDPTASSAAEARAATERSLTQNSDGQSSFGPSSKKESAFAALQKSEALERRASRRFSAYQFAKLANGNQNGLPDIPPLPTSDAVDSARNSVALPTKATHLSSAAEYTSSTTVVDDHEKSRATTATYKPSSESLRSASARSLVSNPIPEEHEPLKEPSSNPLDRPTIIVDEIEEGDISGVSQTETILESTKPISIFLQLGKRTKKYRIDDPASLTIQSLRLHFIEIFAYTASSADRFPDIYILDPSTNVRYELDDSCLGDIKEGTLLALNVDEENDIKKYFDEGLTKIAKSVAELNQRVIENVSVMSQMKDEHAKHAASMSAVMAAAASTEVKKTKTNEISRDAELSRSVSPQLTTSKLQNRDGDAFKQLEGLRKDVAVIHQVSKSSITAAKEQLAFILEKTNQLEDVSNLGDGGSSRAYMEACHKKLSSESDELLTMVDDVQDVIEDMRRDVAQRGVRHSERHVKSVAKELSLAVKSFERMEKYLAAERPSWKKIWENELDTICEEQQFFKLQEELVEDLRDDLQKAQETFSLVEACSLEQQKGGGKRRPTPPTFFPSPVDGIVHAKDAVLSEVSALQPNHEARVEAIERAEKMREREKKMIGGDDDFELELKEFVTENKLKKSGGVEEAERRRVVREKKAQEEARKNEADIREMRRLEREQKRKEKQAAGTAAQTIAPPTKTDSAISSTSSSTESGLADNTTTGFSSPDLADMPSNDKSDSWGVTQEAAHPEDEAEDQTRDHKEDLDE